MIKAHNRRPSTGWPPPHPSTMAATPDTGKWTHRGHPYNAKTPAALLQVSLEKPRPGLLTSIFSS